MASSGPAGKPRKWWQTGGGVGVATIIAAMITVAGAIIAHDRLGSGSGNTVVTNGSGNVNNFGSGNVTVERGATTPLSVQLTHAAYIQRMGAAFCRLDKEMREVDSSGKCVFPALNPDAATHNLEFGTLNFVAGEIWAGNKSVQYNPSNPDISVSPSAPHLDTTFDYPRLIISENEYGNWSVYAEVVNSELYARNVTLTCSSQGASSSLIFDVAPRGEKNVVCAYYAAPPSWMEWKLVTHYDDGDRTTDYGRCNDPAQPGLILRECANAYKP